MPKPGNLTMHALLMLLGVSLLAACDASQFGVGGTQQTLGTEVAPTRGIRGVVLDMTGAPAGGVAVRGTLISNNSGGLISNNGSNLISNGSGLYRIQSGFETKTAEDGTFVFNASDDQVLTLEAIQRETIKAIMLGVSSSAKPFTLQLAPTGHIKGRVVPADPAVTDLLNVDVFIPGTSYVAKTDATGNFTLSNVPAGRFTLAADHQNLGRAILSGVTVTSNTTLTTPNLELSTHTPVLASVSPDHGAPGSVVTVKGNHFGISSGKRPDVLLNGVSAQIVSATDTEIKAMIPLGSVSGTVRVSVSGLASATQEFRVLRRLDLFPEYQSNSTGDPFATPPTTDILAVGASRSYHVRAFDTEGRLIPSPTVSWSTIGNEGAGFADGILKPTLDGRVAIAAVSGSLSSAPLSVEILRSIKGVRVLPKLSPLNPVDLTVPEAQRSSVPDWVQLQPMVVLDDDTERAIPFWYRSLHADLSVTETGLTRIAPNSANGTRQVEIIPVADPTKRLTLDIPVLRQGDLSFIIQ